jgi:hypothetical protein
MTFSASPGQDFSGPVASLGDSYTANTAGDFTATIRLGRQLADDDRTVTGGNGTFTVSGTHIYSSAGQIPVQVTLTDDAPGTTTKTAMSTADVTRPRRRRQHSILDRGQHADCHRLAPRTPPPGICGSRLVPIARPIGEPQRLVPEFRWLNYSSRRALFHSAVGRPIRPRQCGMLLGIDPIVAWSIFGNQLAVTAAGTLTTPCDRSASRTCSPMTQRAII